jgi:DNA-binding NtrC family response regulator
MSSILIVEDNRPLASSFMEFLRCIGPEVSLAETGEAAWEMMTKAPPSVVLLDLRLPDMNGLELLTRAQAEGLPTSFVVVTADGSISQAVEAMRAGAEDFVVKPASPDRLRVTVQNALKRQALESQVRTYQEQLDRKGLGKIIGASLPMQAVYRIVESAAPSKATVFITGKSGTGKELCAEAIHSLSPRASKPFVALNCAAIPRELVESEIFGHVKGAFTGAAEGRVGAAGQAKGGTLFLDEICELAIDLQSKLLRFIQTGTYQRVGSSKTEKADIRFVCATNRDPLEEVRAGRFREDLYYRLHVIPIEMPPLCDRADDVINLAEAFLQRFAREERKKFKAFTPESQDRLLAYEWPGNVRELENAVQQIAVLHDGDAVTLEMLPSTVCESGLKMSDRQQTKPGGDKIEEAAAVQQPLWKIERDAIEKAIAACGGSIPKAAALLEVSPSTIYRKRESWVAEERLG